MTNHSTRRILITGLAVAALAAAVPAASSAANVGGGSGQISANVGGGS